MVPKILPTLMAFKPMTDGDGGGRSATKVCESICESPIEGNPRTVAAKGNCATRRTFQPPFTQGGLAKFSQFASFTRSIVKPACPGL
jgi:hypothetical protein